jgi:nucleoside-diphosphate kinase|tara:strand:+ start:515 stop:919 length:405 start_codon:yes stop_codon:yes gene_type:complete
MSNQRTLSIIKPNAVKKNKIGLIIALLEEAKLKVVEVKMITLSVEKAESFYSEHKGKPFFNELIAFMTSGPLVIMALEGEDAINTNRKIMGATNPAEALEGTIRAKYGDGMTENAVHGSDGLESASRELKFFFG